MIDTTQADHTGLVAILHRVKLTEFPDGSREAVLMEEPVYRPDAQVLHLKAQALKRGDGTGYVHERLDADLLSETNVERACRRARKQVRHYIRRIGADHMLTVTYRENQVCYRKAKADWKAFVRLIHKELPGWAYVVVSERQERGAIHFHAAVKGRQDVELLRRCWLRIVGDGMGNIDVKGPTKRWNGEGSTWKQQKLSDYLTKYLSKAFDDAEASSKRYWASRDVPPLKVTAFYLECQDMTEAVRITYGIVAGGLAVDVTQWMRPGGGTYWIASARPPSLPF